MDVLKDSPPAFTARFGRGRNQFYQWKAGRQLPPKRVLEETATREGWPREIFEEDGRRPKDLVNSPVNARPGTGQLVVRGRAYRTPHGASAREAVDRIIDSIRPEDLLHVANLEIAEAYNRGGAMDAKRLRWWLERAFEAGRQVGVSAAAGERKQRRGRG